MIDNKTQTEFQPTYLCIKQHSVTKKLYFCKTTKDHDAMLKYKGSGDRWLSHLNKHRNEEIETIWYCLFYDREEIEKFSLTCSNLWNIVESDEWANIIPENGLTGFPAGLSFSTLHTQHLSEAKQGRTWEEIYGEEGAALKRKQNSKPKGAMKESQRKNISEAKKGMNAPHNWNKKSRQKVRDKLLGIIRTKKTIQKMKEAANIIKTCPQCGITGSGPAMQRWHFNHCKSIKKN